ncbi:MAG: serine/threonine-protein kinase [Nannocystaceae bacterium]
MDTSAQTKARAGDDGGAGEVEASTATRVEPGASAGTPTPISSQVTNALEEAAATAAEVPGAGGRIGRYMLLRRLGAGGMGEVFLAYDDELDRRVAIKILHPGRGGGAASQRLLREAQALARLNHPNVVHVHEVGAVDGRVFVVMEYVEGDDLRAWLKERRLVGRPATAAELRTILDLMIQAGRGLAAAHRVGLAHRDVKPDNIFVGDDGRVRVGDFGLARMGAGAGASESGVGAVAQSSASGSVLSAPITRAGGVPGTPAYMAPEQRVGLFDARSDLFAFTVALWELVMGERPFAGTRKELATRIAGGERRPPAEGHAAPRWLLRALDRGLRPHPNERWPSMDALLAELEAAPQRRWRWLVGAASCVGVAVVVAALLSAQQALAERCSGAEAQLAGIWDEARVGAVEAAVRGTEVSYAGGVWSRLEADLGGYAAQWVDMHDDACEATAVRREQSSEVMDLRMACLDRALEELKATVALLETADVELLPQAHEVVADLPPLARCADTDALQAAVEPPRADEAGAVAEARGALAVARARRGGGRFAAAQAAIGEAGAAAEGLSYAPLAAELRRERGLVLAELGRYEEADADLREALRLGGRAGIPTLVGAAAIDLIGVVGRRRSLPDEGLRYRDVADAAIGDDPREAGRLTLAVAEVYAHDGRYAEAAAEYGAAIERIEAAFGDANPLLAAALIGNGDVLRRLERWEEAEARLARAQAIVERDLGDGHPLLARLLNVLATLRKDRGELDEALALFERALALRQAALGPEHPSVADSMNNLAVIRYNLGALDEATRLYRESVAIRERNLGPDHPGLAGPLTNLASVTCLTHGCADSIPLFERALKLIVDAHGEAHPVAVAVLTNLGNVYNTIGRDEPALEYALRAEAAARAVYGDSHRQVLSTLALRGRAEIWVGRRAEAEAHLRDALTMCEALYGADDLHVVPILVDLSVVARGRGRGPEAVAWSERALALVELHRDKVEEYDQASVRFALGQALALDRSQRRRALALVRDARERLGDAEQKRVPIHYVSIRELDAWIAAHR